MNQIKNARKRVGMSQRMCAKRAGISYKALQLIESGNDFRLSTLQKLGVALGYDFVAEQVGYNFQLPANSACIVSQSIQMYGESSWKVYLFNFVDAFRKAGERSYVDSAPSSGLSHRMLALIASVVESLCDELEMEYPFWTLGVKPLPQPWFISGMENLKASALIESPIHFKKRNIFVLKNFLDRV